MEAPPLHDRRPRRRLLEPDRATTWAAILFRDIGVFACVLFRCEGRAHARFVAQYLVRTAPAESYLLTQVSGCLSSAVVHQLLTADSSDVDDERADADTQPTHTFSPVSDVAFGLPLDGGDNDL